jgi:uncharacterized protein
MINQGAGRSAYLCPQANCLQTAQKKNRLSRCLKTAVPEAIYLSLWQELEQAKLVDPQASATQPSQSWQNG